MDERPPINSDGSHQQAPKRLRGRNHAVGAVPGFSPWGMMLFGLPFAGIGAAITLVGLEVIPVKASDVHAPMWVLTICGLVFFLAGLMVWGMAWSQAFRERRRRQHALLHPGEPAMQDHPWNPTGFSPKRWKPAIQGFSTAIFLSVFLSIFNWWAFGSGEGPLMVKIIVSIFNLILIFVWWNAVKSVIHAIKFGHTRLEFGQFPYYLGDWFQARILLPSNIERVEHVDLVLRCVQEFYATSGSGKNRRKSLVHEQLWAEEQELSGAEIGPWPRYLNATFVLPAAIVAPGSQITSEKPVFWELEMEMKVPGVDLTQRYLVPVYAKDFETSAASGVAA